ncbi:MAG: transglutaminase, partial [Proteobacteria bacterium]|nr:transglutaminase [Pseudomonadota bacterium]
DFDGPARHADTVEIELPAHYRVDELPPPVNVDLGFASYHSKSEVVGRKLRYTRDFELRELSVPSSKADELMHLYRTVYTDERRNAVLVRGDR